MNSSEFLENSGVKQPQPVNYGLTYEEVFDGLCVGDGRFVEELPESGFAKFKYKEGERVKFWTLRAVAIWLVVYTGGFLMLAMANGLAWNSARAYKVFFVGMLFPGSCFLVITCDLVQGAAQRRIRKKLQQHRNPGVLAFREALCEYKRHELLLREKEAYWNALSPREFEIETAKVLELHRFNPILVGGPGDGGVDIKVTRNGLEGLVQCKALSTSVRPNAARDLFGAIHHRKADFGILVSRNGFTERVKEFAKDKPIALVETSDLIAMAAGRDVLHGMFSDRTKVKPRIMWVDNDIEFLQKMESIFGSEIEIVKFQKGEEAWQELQREDPDGFITDMMRPGDTMDGWAIIPRLAEKRVKFPVIVVSFCSEALSGSLSGGSNSELAQPIADARFQTLMQDARKTLNITVFYKGFVEIDPSEQRRLLEELRFSINE